MSQNSLKIKDKVRLGWGKIRRFLQINFRRKKVYKNISNRIGECARCGKCCHLLIDCPFLRKNKDGITLCVIHKTRPGNCRYFPITQKDIEDRNIGNTCKCGYSFVEKKDNQSTSNL